MESTKLVKAPELKAGMMFRMGGWKCSITYVEKPRHRSLVLVQFKFLGSGIDSGEFVINEDCEFSIISAGNQAKE